MGSYKQRRWLAEVSRKSTLSLFFHVISLLFWKADIITLRMLRGEEGGGRFELSWCNVEEMRNIITSNLALVGCSWHLVKVNHTLHTAVDESTLLLRLHNYSTALLNTLKKYMYSLYFHALCLVRFALLSEVDCLHVCQWFFTACMTIHSKLQRVERIKPSEVCIRWMCIPQEECFVLINTGAWKGI